MTIRSSSGIHQPTESSSSSYFSHRSSQSLLFTTLTVMVWPSRQKDLGIRRTGDTLDVIGYARDQRRLEVVAVTALILDVCYTLLGKAFRSRCTEWMKQEASANPDREILVAIEAVDTLCVIPLSRIGHRRSDTDYRREVSDLVSVPSP